MRQIQNPVGDQIRKYRKRAGISQIELEMLLNTSNGVVSRIETNSVQPSAETLKKIIKVLHLNTYEAAHLFGISITDYSPVLDVSKKLYLAQNIDDVFQNALDSFVTKMSYSAGFITVVKNNRIYSKYLSSSKMMEFAQKIISKHFSQYYIELERHKGNFCARAVIEQRTFIVNDITNIIYPAISKELIACVKVIIDVKSAIVIPIVSLSGESIGSIVFYNRKYRNFQAELPVITEFTEHISYALCSLDKK